jgi:hypothetical protein
LGIALSKVGILRGEVARQLPACVVAEQGPV